jgi:hypothetical protein
MTIVRILREHSPLARSVPRLTANPAGTTYEPISGLCYSASTSPWFMGVWVSEVRQHGDAVGAGRPKPQIAFELAVLGATCWNTLDRPRVANETMARALRRDGIVYFACVSPQRARVHGVLITSGSVIASLRIINLVLAATENVLYAYTVT